MDLEGLADNGHIRVSPQILGHRGSRFVVDASHVKKAPDKDTGLQVFPITGVFTNPNVVFLGFGWPNVYLVVPHSEEHIKGPGWDKFAAFMFWRQPAFVANTKGRVQVGVLFELCHVPDEGIKAIRTAMKQLSGKRTISCANANARVLTAAGFTCNGKPLSRVYRPSQLASIIWRHGLEYNGQPIQIRIIQTGDSVPDHFRSVWGKEVTSLCRTIKKKFYQLTGHRPAPTFEPESQTEISPDFWPEDDSRVTIRVSRPSWLGTYLGFIFGEHPVFETIPEQPLEGPEFKEPLKAFRNAPNFSTKLKKHVLFRKQVVWLINRHLEAKIDTNDNVPASAIVRMLRLSESEDRETAFLYNFVITGSCIRLTRLKNGNGRDNRFINWILAKHVLLSKYDPTTQMAGEVWAYLDENHELVLCVNDNSGTYQPEGRLQATARYLGQTFKTKVKVLSSR